MNQKIKNLIKIIKTIKKIGLTDLNNYLYLILKRTLFPEIYHNPNLTLKTNDNYNDCVQLFTNLYASNFYLSKIFIIKKIKQPYRKPYCFVKIYHYIWYLKTKDNFHNKNTINLKTKHNKPHPKCQSLVNFINIAK